jgi:anti-sigma B factor antagonist
MTLYELGRAGTGNGLHQADGSTIEHGQLTVRIGPMFETCLIQLSGDLDGETCQALDRELRRIEATDVDTIVLDLGALEFLDSAGIAMLLDAVERSRFDGERLRLLRPTEKAGSLLRLMDLEDSLPYLD